MRASLGLVALSILLAVTVACGDDDPAGADAANQADADPTAPDSAPGSIDADPGAPDANTTSYDAPVGSFDANTGDPGAIACGEAECTSPQVCCVSYSGGITSECTAADGCSGNATIACDGPEDCTSGTDVCCSGGIANPSSSCSAAASCDTIVCRETSECNVGGGETCCDLTVGISVCSTICF